MLLPTTKKSFGARIVSDQSEPDIHSQIIQALNTIGPSAIDETGQIRIDTSRYNGIGHRHKVVGTLTKNSNSKYSVRLAYTGRSKFLSIPVLLVIFITLGIGLAFIAFQQMTAIQKLTSKLEQVEKDIEFAFSD